MTTTTTQQPAAQAPRRTVPEMHVSIKRLALQKGVSCVLPKTGPACYREIQQLLALPDVLAEDAQLERTEIADALAPRPDDRDDDDAEPRGAKLRLARPTPRASSRWNFAEELCRYQGSDGIHIVIGRRDARTNAVRVHDCGPDAPRFRPVAEGLRQLQDLKTVVYERVAANAISKPPADVFARYLPYADFLAHWDAAR